MQGAIRGHAESIRLAEQTPQPQRVKAESNGLGPLPITASAIGDGASFLAVPAAVTALIRAAIPPSEWIGALTAFTIVFAAGQTGGPYLAGTLADRYGTGATLAWTTAVCAIAAALGLVTRSDDHRTGR